MCKMTISLKRKSDCSHIFKSFVCVGELNYMLHVFKVLKGAIFAKCSRIEIVRPIGVVLFHFDDYKCFGSY